MTEKDSAEFGQFIKKLRKQKGYSIRKLAAKAQISASHISRAERGERPPFSPEILKKLAGVLPVSYEELLYRAGYISKDSALLLKIINLNKEEVEVLKKIVDKLKFLE
jgi:transcriptional regulator with XRE-family HTH domain